MEIKQFEYKPLAHYSYAISSEGKMAIIDPERDPLQYYEWAETQNAKIVAIIQTHPHADFVSAHLQIHQETGANIYNSKMLGAEYPHKGFDEGDSITLGKATLSARNTPGHSPDSITVVAEEEDQVALFTGDTLFIGDVGRPDLREKAGKMTAKRQELAAMMYETIQHKFTDVPDHALVYPAHGAGSLCGKNLSSDASSTLGNERMGNWAFKEQTQEEFVATLLDSQPFIPAYFGFNVDINKAGARNVRQAMGEVDFKLNATSDVLVVDTRAAREFKTGHLPGSINIQATSIDDKFETWLGSVVNPGETFDLVISGPGKLHSILERLTKIGYEGQLRQVITLGDEQLVSSPKIDLEDFRKNPSAYTIVDIRNQSEINTGKFFDEALAHPLNQLRESAGTIPTDKPVVVHCAGGYRSAAGSSILEGFFSNIPVYDLSESINDFK